VPQCPPLPHRQKMNFTPRVTDRIPPLNSLAFKKSGLLTCAYPGAEVAVTTPAVLKTLPLLSE
jgi:hypothetical protein